MEDFFSSFQKDTTASRIVPLAMKKLELDMEREKFDMAKTKAMQDIGRENLLRSKMNELFKPQEQEVTLPAIEAPTVNTMFGGKATLGEGLPATTTKQTVNRKPSIDEITSVLMQHGKDPEKVLKDLITENKPIAVGPQNDLINPITKEIVYQNKNVKPETLPSWQSTSVTEKGGFPIWKNPKSQVTEVIKPDGKRETYDPAKHGRELSQNLSQTTIYNNDKKGEVGFKTWTPEAKTQEFMEHMITGTPPVNTRGLAGGDRQQYAKEFAQWKVDKGITPQVASALKSDYKANDMSLKNMTKQEAPMSAFVLNINKQIGKLQELYTDANRTGLRVFDYPIRELTMKAKGSGKEASIASYLLEVSNEIGKLSSGASASVQQLSDSAKEDWKKVHDPNLSMKEILLVLNSTRDQANMRMSTWREAKEEVRKTMRFLGTPEKDETTTARPNVIRYDAKGNRI